MTGTMTDSGTSRIASRFAWFGWACYLACSWTWCIGMFLPVLLMRDYGVRGWVVFAVPNVLGAAAMGWVLGSAQVSYEIAASHRRMCAAFSAVAIAFHLFFAVAVISPLVNSMDLAVGTVIAASIVMYLLMTRQHGFDRALAWATLLISLAVMMLTIGEVRIPVEAAPEKVPTLFMPFDVDLVWLAPVCVFGFFGCPYLDLTFHRARQNSDRPRASFGVGFGVLFLVMIVFTAIYALPLNAKVLTPMLGMILFVHMATQSAFTIAAHARELRQSNGCAAVFAAILALGAWALHWTLRRNSIIDGLDPGELIYRVFMGFYGLVFPAYVWLVMMPTRGGAPTRRNLLVLAAAVLMAMPMFWLGFVAGRMIWLGPGLAIVLLARLLVRNRLVPHRA